jgi:hypothetical protein
LFSHLKVPLIKVHDTDAQSKGNKPANAEPEQRSRFRLASSLQTVVLMVCASRQQKRKDFPFA